MNYLQLAQQLRQECGGSGTGPATTVAQTGENKRYCDWINAAWLDIQELHEDWDWMRTAFQFATTTQQQLYTPVQCGVTDLGVWARWSFRLSTTSMNYADEMLMSYMDFDTWRNLYAYGNMRTTYARPIVFTINPARSIGLGPIPDAAGYTVNGDYYHAPVTLTADADIPQMPAKYHMAIVYRAMTHYASYEAAPEVQARAETEYKRMFARLAIDQLANASLIMGPPLA